MTVGAVYAVVVLMWPVVDEPPGVPDVTWLNAVYAVVSVALWMSGMLGIGHAHGSGVRNHRIIRAS